MAMMLDEDPDDKDSGASGSIACANTGPQVKIKTRMRLKNRVIFSFSDR
jgi:hypothetical protein